MTDTFPNTTVRSLCTETFIGRNGRIYRSICWKGPAKTSMSKDRKGEVASKINIAVRCRPRFDDSDCFFFFFIDRKIHHQFFLSSLSTNPGLKMKFARNFLFFFSLNFPFHVILWSTSNALYCVKKNSSLIIKCPSNVHLFFIQFSTKVSTSTRTALSLSLTRASFKKALSERPPPDGPKEAQRANSDFNQKSLFALDAIHWIVCGTKGRKESSLFSIGLREGGGG